MSGLRSVQEARRRRSLASDSRAGSWARGRARVAQRQYVLQRWRHYSFFMGGTLVASLFAAWLMPTSFLKGVAVGGLLVGGVAALWSLTVQATGTAPKMMGDLAEQWTAGGLRKLRPRGWLTVNHFGLGKGDIDHVAIGPYGVLAIETKWSATAWSSDFGQARLREAVVQAGANARSLRLWHPIKSRQMAVHPIVVLWAGGVKDWPEADWVTEFDGVSVLAGQALPRWAADYRAAEVGESVIAEVWGALDAQVARRDPLERLEYPVPPSVEELSARLGGAVFCAVLGFVWFGHLIRVVEPWWVAAGLGALSAILAVPLLTHQRARFAAWGWLIGLGLPVIALTFAEAIVWMAP